MKFEFYVLNYDSNKKKVVRYNIFNNWNVQERTEKVIRKYLRAPNKYKYIKQYESIIPELGICKPEVFVYGFDGLCEEIKSIIRWQEWGRREYEISVADAFTYEASDALKDFQRYESGKISLEQFKELLEKEAKINSPLEKWDCYMQCEYNIPMIARECIYQYKQQRKEEKNEI